jgi:hypothetical protein
MIESVRSMKLPPKGELCTLSDFEIFYTRLKETLVYSRWLREEAIRCIRLNRANPIILDCLGRKGKVFKSDPTQVQSNWIQFFFNIMDDEIEKLRSQKD